LLRFWPLELIICSHKFLLRPKFGFHMPSGPFASEDQFIARFLAPLTSSDVGAFNLKDDAAVFKPPEGYECVITTDSLVENVHFLFDGTVEEAREVARKALAVNVSDLAAKGAKPYAYLLALILPKDRPATSWFSGFAQGLSSAQHAWNLHLLGGDTTQHASVFAITITAMGWVPIGCMVRRSGAQAGDSLYVTGTIGDASAGLRLRQGVAAGESITQCVGQNAALSLLKRYQRPEPRLSLVPIVQEYASAAMDVSDGLALDLDRLMQTSGTGAEVLFHDIPLSAPMKSLLAANLLTPEDILSGGDDYEILAAIPADNTAAFESACLQVGQSVSKIGRVTSTIATDILDHEHQPIRLLRTGYDHFSSK
jgi:thiamine-monophosphate kinase